ncbi:zinc-binding dehydrogenase [bacterium]|nr:zinc-binding dehydrogenase [bacterium]
MTPDTLTNQAAWARAPFADLSLGPAPVTAPGPGEILVRNRAVAINPVDRYKQKMGNLMFGWIRYPFIFGYDLSGEVVAVGPDVTRFRPGDRVLGVAIGMDKPRNRAAEGAFQQFTLVQARMAAPLPEGMSHAEACVMPLALSTAATGLFAPEHLALSPPFADPVDQGKTVLIWGGSTSVGCNAIQLARAAGYRVVTTASPANAALVRRLGAVEVIDHYSPTAVEAVTQALRGVEVAGALAMGAGSAAACIAVLRHCQGRRRVALATFPIDIDGLPPRPGPGTALTRVLPAMIGAGAGLWWRARRGGVTFSVIYGTALAETDLSRVIFEDYLPGALASARFVPAPEPLVAGHGLEAVQAAIDRHRQGVSARKVVVTL